MLGGDSLRVAVPSKGRLHEASLEILRRAGLRFRVSGRRDGKRDIVGMQFALEDLMDQVRRRTSCKEAFRRKRAGLDPGLREPRAATAEYGCWLRFRAERQGTRVQIGGDSILAEKDFNII